MWHGPHRMAVIPIIRVVDLRSYCIVCGRRVEAWCGESRGFCVNARGGLRSALQRSVESRVECSERRDRVFGFACGICMIVPNQRARVPRARPRTSEQHGAVRSARSDLHAWPICRVCPRVTRHTRHARRALTNDTMHTSDTSDVVRTATLHDGPMSNISHTRCTTWLDIHIWLF